MDKSAIALILSFIGITISIISIVISIIIFKKNKKITLKINAQNQLSKRSGRISLVVNEYFRLSDIGKSNGIMGLIQAGMGNLEDETETKEVISLIISRTGKNPLSDRQAEIEEIGILKLFQKIDRKQYIQGKLDEIINKLRNEK